MGARDFRQGTRTQNGRAECFIVHFVAERFQLPEWSRGMLQSAFCGEKFIAKVRGGVLRNVLSSGEHIFNSNFPLILRCLAYRMELLEADTEILNSD